MAANWATRLTPEPFRDFLPYTSVSALKVIHMPGVLARALGIVRHFGSESERARSAETLAASLREANLAIAVGQSAPRAPLLGAEVLPKSRVVVGKRMLELYFHQLHAPGPWFLDLRPRHFAWNEQRQLLTFYPSGLWYEPDADFRRRVQALYAGLYRNEDAELAQGIELYSWASRPLAGFSARIEHLLREHFGPGDASNMCFSIAHFRETFDRIFREAVQSRAKLHPDLTFLGVGLVGLYLTLESLQVALNPREAYELAAPIRLDPHAA